jgi:hypothetical protein
MEIERIGTIDRIAGTIRAVRLYHLHDATTRRWRLVLKHVYAASVGIAGLVALPMAGGVARADDPCPIVLGEPALHASGIIRGLAVGDLNGDALSDVVVSENDLEQVSIWLATSPGRYGDRQVVQTGANASFVEIVDLNGDGHQDFAVACGLAGLTVHLNRGDGTFAAPRSYTASSGGLAFGDLDADGDLDALMGYAGVESTIEVLFNDGHGVFGPRVSYPVGRGVRSTKLADVDGDGDLDALAISLVTDSLTVFKNRGNGEFVSPAMVYPMGDRPVDLAMHDLDGDGDLDAMAVSEETDGLTVALNDGTGRFLNSMQYPASRYLRKVVAGDYDLDGIADVVALGVSESRVIFWRGVGDGTLLAPRTVTVADQVSALSLADVDLNGTPDLTTAYTTGRVTVQVNDGEGEFWNTPIAALESDASTVIRADMDGDGDEDLIIRYDGLPGVGLVENGPGDSLIVWPYSEVLIGRYFDVADLDDDGDLDLLGTYGDDMVHFAINEGEGRFVDGGSVRTGEDPSGITMADFDGDGIRDIAYVYGYRGIGVLRGRPDGGFQTPLHVAVPFDNGQDVISGDLNDDGRADLILLYDRQSIISVYLGAAAGGFEPHRWYLLGGEGLVGQALADIDEDGDIDFVFANAESRSLGVLLNDGMGDLGTLVRYDIPFEVSTFDLADMQGDGVLDAVVSLTVAGDIGVVYGDGFGGFAGASVFVNYLTPYWSVPIDFDQDGDMDVISTSWRDPEMQLFRNEPSCPACPVDLDGDGETTLFDFLAFQSAFDAGDPIADFDGDGAFTLFDFLAFQTQFAAGCP